MVFITGSGQRLGSMHLFRTLLSTHILSDTPSDPLNDVYTGAQKRVEDGRRMFALHSMGTCFLMNRSCSGPYLRGTTPFTGNDFSSKTTTNGCIKQGASRPSCSRNMCRNSFVIMCDNFVIKPFGAPAVFALFNMFNNALSISSALGSGAPSPCRESIPISVSGSPSDWILRRFRHSSRTTESATFAVTVRRGCLPLMAVSINYHIGGPWSRFSSARPTMSGAIFPGTMLKFTPGSKALPDGVTKCTSATASVLPVTVVPSASSTR